MDDPSLDLGSGVKAKEILEQVLADKAGAAEYLQQQPLIDVYKALEHAIAQDARKKIDLSKLGKQSNFLRENAIKPLIDITTARPNPLLKAIILSYLEKVKEITQEAYADYQSQRKAWASNHKELLNKYSADSTSHAINAINYSDNPEGNAQITLGALTASVKEAEKIEIAFNRSLKEKVYTLTQEFIDTIFRPTRKQLIPDEVRLTCAYIRKACSALGDTMTEEITTDFIAGYFITRVIGPLIYPTCANQLYDATQTRERVSSFDAQEFSPRSPRKKSPRKFATLRRGSSRRSSFSLPSRPKNELKEVVTTSVKEFFANPLQKLATAKNIEKEEGVMTSKNTTQVRNFIWCLAEADPQLERNISLRTKYTALVKELRKITEESNHEKALRLQVIKKYDAQDTKLPTTETIERMVKHIKQVIDGNDIFSKAAGGLRSSTEKKALGELKIKALKLKKVLLAEFFTITQRALKEFSSADNCEFLKKANRGIPLFISRVQEVTQLIGTHNSQQDTTTLLCLAIRDSEHKIFSDYVFEMLSEATDYPREELEEKLECRLKIKYEKMPGKSRAAKAIREKIKDYLNADSNAELPEDLFAGFAKPLDATVDKKVDEAQFQFG